VPDGGFGTTVGAGVGVGRGVGVFTGFACLVGDGALVRSADELVAAVGNWLELLALDLS
jgi:hypothetical protein